MEFESVEQTAKRLHVTTRTVQKWAKAGKISGASQMGRTWLIPCDFSAPTAVASSKGFDKTPIRPLLDVVFVPGRCLDYVMSFPEGMQRDVMLAQYHYFCGDSEKAVQLARPYLEHENPVAALIASVTYSFAKLSLGNAHLFQVGQEHIQKYAKVCLEKAQDPRSRAYAVYIATMVHVVMHVECPPMPPLEQELKYLPEGAKLHAGYLMAHEAYLAKDYERCLGILEMAMSMHGDTYVIPAIYLHLMASIVLMNLRRIVEAKVEFEKAWELIRRDGLIAVFGEHIGMLQGLLEVCLKKQYPKEYVEILKMASSFADGWRQVHNVGAQRTVTEQLTTVEMAVASLFHRGWSVKEISAYMEISPRMIRHHISIVYEKVGISHREELAQYMVL